MRIEINPRDIVPDEIRAKLKDGKYFIVDEAPPKALEALHFCVSVLKALPIPLDREEADAIREAILMGQAAIDES